LLYDVFEPRNLNAYHELSEVVDPSLRYRVQEKSTLVVLTLQVVDKEQYV